MIRDTDKKIVYSNPFVPPEWIAAHGLLPCRIMPPGEGKSSHAGRCPYAQAFVNAAQVIKDGAAVVLTTTCDQMRRAHDTLQGSGLPTFLLQVPSTWEHNSSLKAYNNEIKRLGSFLTELGGIPPTCEQLKCTMLDFDSKRTQVRASRRNIPGRVFCELAFGHGRGISMFPSQGKQNGIPIALFGSPITAHAMDLLDVIESAGGRIAWDGSESGEGGLCRPFNRQALAADPFQEMVRAYFSSIIHIGRRPNQMVFDWLREQVKNTKVSGVIFHRQVWCDLWHAEVARIREIVKVPMMDLESTGAWQAEAPRLRTRIEAFVEALS